VVTPSGGNDEEVWIRMVAGVGRDPATCTPGNDGAGCIIARRALHYLPHTRVRLRVPLRAVCAGVACAPSETCVSGACVSATVQDPAACAGEDGCGEEAVVPAADGGGPSPVDAGNAGDAGAGDGGDAEQSSLPDAGPCPGDVLDANAVCPSVGVMCVSGSSCCGCVHGGGTQPCLKWVCDNITKNSPECPATPPTSGSPCTTLNDVCAYCSSVATNYTCRSSDGGLGWSAGTLSPFCF
jgi:hypothetical protein